MEFKSLDHAFCELEKAHAQGRINEEAIEYIILNATPEIMEVLREGFRKFFPDVKPAYVDDDGNAWFDAEAIRKATGFSDEQLEEQLDRLNRKHVRYGTDGLHRVQ